MTAAASAKTAAQDTILAAISSASRRTGADFTYLVDTAMRESALDPQAAARTSTAAGLFQFIEQTWLGALKKHGPALGLGSAAAAISTDASGRHRVADPSLEKDILEMRFDPQTSSLMAGAVAVDSAQALEARLGRPLKPGELYASHFLGLNGAATLIELAERAPDRPAAEAFPQAAAANRPVFYDGSGRARSAADLLAKLTATSDPAPAAAPGSEGRRVSAGVSAGDAAGPRTYRGAWRGGLLLTPVALNALNSIDPTRVFDRD